MARKLIALKGDEPVRYRDEDDGDEQGLLLLADGLTSPQVYPEDYEVSPPTAPGAWATSAVPKPSTVPVGLTWGQNTISVAPNAAPSAALVKGHPGPKRFAGNLPLLLEGPVLTASFLLPSTITGLSGAGGEAFAGLSDSLGENGVFVGLDVDGTGNLRAYAAIRLAGVEITRGVAVISGSGGQNQWLHLRAQLQRENYSANNYLPRIDLQAAVGTDGEIDTVPTWATRFTDAAVSESNFNDLLTALEADQGGFHVVGVEPHSTDVWSTLIGSVGVY